MTLEIIIVMSIYAVLCGYTDAENMAFFMKLQEPYFEKMLDLKYGVPSADTLLRVFALIEPEKLSTYQSIEKNHGRVERRK